MPGQSLDYSQIAIDNLISEGLIASTDAPIMVPLTAALFDTESSGDINAMSPNKRNMGIGQIDSATAQTVMNRHPELKGLDITNPEDNATLSAMNLVDGISMQGGLDGGLEQYRGGPGSVGKNTKDKSFGENATEYKDKFTANLDTVLNNLGGTYQNAVENLKAQETLITGKAATNISQQEVTSDIGVAIQKSIADEAYTKQIEDQKFLQRQAVTTGLYDTTLSKQAAATQTIANQQSELGQKWAGVYDTAANGNIFERWWAKNVDTPKLKQEQEILDNAGKTIAASGTAIRNQLATNLTVSDYRNKLQSTRALELNQEAAKNKAQATGDTTRQELINLNIGYMRQLFQGDISMARLGNEAARIQTRQQEWGKRQLESGNVEKIIDSLAKVGKPGFTKETLMAQSKEFLQSAGELSAAIESGSPIVGDFQHKLTIVQSLNIPPEYWDTISPGFTQSYQENEQAQQQALESIKATGATKVTASDLASYTNKHRVENNKIASVKTVSQYANPEDVKEEFDLYSKELQGALTAIAKTDGGTLDGAGQTAIVKSVIDYLKTNSPTLSDEKIGRIVWPLVELKMSQSKRAMSSDLVTVPEDFGLTFQFPETKSGLLTDSVVQGTQTGINGADKFQRMVIVYLATKKTVEEKAEHAKLIGFGGFR